MQFLVFLFPLPPFHCHLAAMLRFWFFCFSISFLFLFFLILTAAMLFLPCLHPQ